MKTKRTLALFVALCMIFNIVPILWNNTFAAESDISNHWAKKTIEEWAQKGYISGYKDGSYRPNGLVTRAEMAVFINNLKGYSGHAEEIDRFTDVSSDAWYYKAISTAVKNGYLKGIGNNLLGPNQFITRSEAVSILVNISQPAGNINLGTIKDASEIPVWAKTNFELALANGFLSGHEGYLSPNKNITRAEAISLLDNFENKNRVIAFPGEYTLGTINGLKINQTNIKISNTLIEKDILLSKNLSGKIELFNTKIKGKILSENNLETNNIQIFMDGVELKYQNGEFIVSSAEMNEKKYKDGIFEGTAKGYNGDVKVSVEIKDDKIISIKVVDHKEDKIYFNSAMKVIDKIIQKQDTEVDVNSGATISCKGILFAVKDALKKALIKTEDLKPGKYKDGEYEGWGFGFKATVKIKVTIKNGNIDKVEMIEHYDDDRYMESAKNLLSEIKDKQKPDVSVISGATYSSNGIINAVKDALSQAEGKTLKPGQSDAYLNNLGGGYPSGGSGVAGSKIEKEFKNLMDGIYEGEADGYRTKSFKVIVTVKDKKISEIDLVHNKDDAGYLTVEKSKKIAGAIIEKQSTIGVDTVSGATASSKGFINAIVNALQKATGDIKTVSSDFDNQGRMVKGLHVVGSAKISNAIVDGDLIIGQEVKDGDVQLQNVTVKGSTMILGGGSNSIHFLGCQLNQDVIVNKESGQRVNVVFEEDTAINNRVIIRSSAIIRTTTPTQIPKLILQRNNLSENKIEINANVKNMDIQSQKAEIIIKKESSIEFLTLPSIVGPFDKDLKEYKDNKQFSLIIENEAIIKDGTNHIIDNPIFSENQIRKIGNNISYKDGIWDGFGSGYFSDPERRMHVQVLVENGKVKNIELKHFGDDMEPYKQYFDSYFENQIKANPSNLDKINLYNEALESFVAMDRGPKNPQLKYQTREEIKKDFPDVLTGATYSGAGVTRAIVDALYKSEVAHKTGHCVVKEIKIKVMPKTKYINEEPLDLSKLIVITVDNEGKEKDISYGDFEKNGLAINHQSGDPITTPFLQNMPITITDKLTQTKINFNVQRVKVFDKFLNIKKMQYKVQDEELKNVDPIVTNRDKDHLPAGFSPNNLYRIQQIILTEQEKSKIETIEFKILDENEKEVPIRVFRETEKGFVSFRITLNTFVLDKDFAYDTNDYIVITNLGAEEKLEAPVQILTNSYELAENTAKANATAADLKLSKENAQFEKFEFEDSGLDNKYFSIQADKLIVSKAALEGKQSEYPKINSDSKTLTAGKYDISIVAVDKSGKKSFKSRAEIIIKNSASLEPKVMEVGYYIGERKYGLKDDYSSLEKLITFNPEMSENEFIEIRTKEDIKIGKDATAINLRFTMQDDKGYLATVVPDDYFLRINSWTGEKDKGKVLKTFGRFDTLHQNGEYIFNINFKAVDFEGKEYSRTYKVKVIQEKTPNIDHPVIPIDPGNSNPISPVNPSDPAPPVIPVEPSNGEFSNGGFIKPASLPLENINLPADNMENMVNTVTTDENVVELVENRSEILVPNSEAMTEEKPSIEKEPPLVGIIH